MQSFASTIPRRLIPERMDDPGLDAHAHRRALAGLRRINLVSRTAGALLDKVVAYAARHRRTSLRLLDVASGGGDVPIALARAAARQHLHLDLTLFDRSPVALEHAAQAGLSIQTMQGDATHSLPGSFDIVTNSLFLHHLTHAQAVAALQNMHRAAAGLLLISDLRRSRLGWVMAHIACRLLSRSPIVHYDGPVSVRAAWTPNELADLAHQSGIDHFTIHSQWPGAHAASIGKTMIEKVWDAIIIGAGPAGAASAALLAGRGWRVLLVERSTWPREKVCGGCLNAHAVALLRQMKLDEAINNASALDQFILHIPTRDLTLPLQDGAAVSRSELDSNLVIQFQKRGGEFLPGASATLLPISTATTERHVAVRINGTENTFRAKIILACDGINGSSLRLEPWAGWRIDRNSWFGLSATLPLASSLPHAIHMHVARNGYVGLARHGDRTTHLAAALSSCACQRAGGPHTLVTQILRECRQPGIPADLKFRGVPALTRLRKSLGGHRVLALGDACGYAEPFTGEGIAWALQSAAGAVELLTDRGEVWPEDLVRRWQKTHRDTIQRRQLRCRAIRPALRSPLLLRAAAALLSIRPRLADSLTHPHLRLMA